MSNDDVTLSTGSIRLTVLPGVGCSWRSLQARTRAGWVELLHPFSGLPGIPCERRLGAFMMAPWCNRIHDAAFTFRGKRVRLRSNLADGSAIHGDVLARAWQPKRIGPTGLDAVLDTRQVAGFNFPTPLSFQHRLHLAGHRIRCALSVTNVGARAVPVGFGFHPFFRRAINGFPAHLHLAAGRAYAGGPRPTRPPRSVPDAMALERGRSLKDFYLDRCFTELSGRVRLRWGREVEAILTMSSPFSHAYVYAPNRHEGRKARFACVEPMTHAPNAFAAFPRTLKVLRPGEKWGGAWSVEIRSPAGAR